MPVLTETPVHRFESDGPLRVSVSQVTGRCEVTAGPAGTATVSVEPTEPADAEAVAYAGRARVRLDGDALSVELPHSRPLRRGHPGVVVRLAVPVGSAFDLHAAAVDLETDGELGDVRVRAAGGSVSVDSSRGDVTVRTAAGGVEVGEVSGVVSVKSASSTVTVGRACGGLTVQGAAGDVHAVRVAGDLRVGTAAGSIRIDALGPGRTRIDTTMGNVEIGVLPGYDVRLDLHSALGVVDCSLAPGGDRPAGRGDADLELRAHTAMGRIDIHPSVV